MDSGHIDEQIWGAYADHLTTADLRLLASAAGRPIAPEELRRDPGAALPLLDRRAVYDAVLGAEAREPGLVVGVSPFLVFAVAVHRYAADLAQRDERPPDEEPDEQERLLDFLTPPARRLFLAELLSSFITPGEAYPTAAGTRRVSGLDPVDLARVLGEVPTDDRPGVYRRFGDVALFLAGVFPDQARRVFGQVQPEALLALFQPPPGQRARPTAAVSLLEWLGSRWYRAAYELAPVRTSRLAVVAEVADRFAVARAALHQIARRHLLPWLSPPRW